MIRRTQDTEDATDRLRIVLQAVGRNRDSHTSQAGFAIMNVLVSFDWLIKEQ